MLSESAAGLSAVALPNMYTGRPDHGGASEFSGASLRSSFFSTTRLGWYAAAHSRKSSCGCNSRPALVVVGAKGGKRAGKGAAGKSPSS